MERLLGRRRRAEGRPRSCATSSRSAPSKESMRSGPGATSSSSSSPTPATAAAQIRRLPTSSARRNTSIPLPVRFSSDSPSPPLILPSDSSFWSTTSSAPAMDEQRSSAPTAVLRCCLLLASARLLQPIPHPQHLAHARPRPSTTSPWSTPATDLSVRRALCFSRVQCRQIQGYV